MRFAGFFLVLVTLSAGAGCGSMKHRQVCGHPGQCQTCGGCQFCGTVCECGNGGGGWFGRFRHHNNCQSNCQSCDGLDYRSGLHSDYQPGHAGSERGGLFEHLWGSYGGHHKCRFCGGRGCPHCRRNGGAGGPGGAGDPGGHGGPNDGSRLGLGPAPAPPPSAAAVAYPYYTNRGPRDFLLNNPPSIGPY